MPDSGCPDPAHGEGRYQWRRGKSTEIHERGAVWLRPRGATGNVATEDLVHMLHEMRIATGVNLEKLIECARLAQSLVGRPLESHIAKSGPVKHTPSGSA